MMAPPSRNAALFIDIASPRLRMNHWFNAVVAPCMNAVEAPIEITRR